MPWRCGDMRWPCFPHVLIHLQFSSVFPLVLWQWWVLHSQENPRSPTNSSWHQAYQATSNSFCKNFDQDAAAALLAIQALSAFTHPAASAPEASSDSSGANLPTLWKHLVISCLGNISRDIMSIIKLFSLIFDVWLSQLTKARHLVELFQRCSDLKLDPNSSSQPDKALRDVKENPEFHSLKTHKKSQGQHHVQRFDVIWGDYLGFACTPFLFCPLPWRRS